MENSYKSILILLLVFFVTNSCVKNTSIQPTASRAEQPVALSRIYSVRDYDIESNELRVSFYESARIYTMPVDAKGFESTLSLIAESKLQHVPIQVSIASGSMVVGAAKATSTQFDDFNKRFEASADVREPYQDVIGSLDELDDIFRWIQKQNCEDGHATIEYCIPFQFKIDGCFARAHKMREILQEHYGYSCNKVFSFGDIFHPLAVDAGDCCLFWSFHVAPLVKVNTDEGIQQRVIDPSLFDGPVTLSQWLGRQDNHSCDHHAEVDHYEILPGSYYFEDGTRDDNYHFTNQTLWLYRDGVTCP